MNKNIIQTLTTLLITTLTTSKITLTTPESPLIASKTPLKQLSKSGFITLNTTDIHTNSITKLTSLEIPNTNSSTSTLGRPSFILLSASTDQSIGRWNEYLEPESRFGAMGARYVKTEVFVEKVAPSNGTTTNFPQFQVNSLRAQIVSDKAYIVANLGGIVLRILRMNLVLDVSVGQDEFEKVKDIRIDSGVGFNGFDLVKQTNFMLVGVKKQILKYEIDRPGDSIFQTLTLEEDESKPKWISYLDIGKKEGFQGDYFTRIVSKKVEVRDVSRMSEIITKVDKMEGIPRKIYSLKGILNIDENQKKTLERQSECAVIRAGSRAAKIVIKDCFNLIPTKREYRRLHGFYEIEHFQLVKSTPLVFTSGGDRRLVLWDITSEEENPIILNENSYDRSVVSFLYEPRLAKIFIGFTHPIKIEVQDQPRSDPLVTIASLSTCLIDDCINCPDAPNRCVRCKEGFANIGNSQCVDCANTDLEIANAPCSIVRRPWRLVKVDPITIQGAGGGRSSRNNGTNLLKDDFGKEFNIGTSSAVFKLLVNDIEYWRPRFVKKDIGGNLHSKFSFYIEGVNIKTYNYTYAIHDSNVFLAMNFTSDFNNKKMVFTIIDPVLVTSDYSFIEEEIERQPDQQTEEDPAKPLILINRTEEITLSGREIIDEATIKTFGTMGRAAGVMITITAVVTGLLAGFSVCFPFGIGAFLLSFFQIIEIISRLSYINVNFGLILTALLEGLDEAMGLPEIPIKIIFAEDHEKYFIDTRGKLTFYEVSPIVLSTIPLFSFLYIAIWLIYLMTIFILKKKRVITPSNLVFVKKVLSLRFMIYGMGILEFMLYSTHGLIHHVQIFDSFASTVSYFTAFLSFSLGVYETIKIVDFARKVFYAEDIMGIDGMRFLSSKDEASKGIEGIDNSVLAMLGFNSFEHFKSSESKSRSSDEKMRRISKHGNKVVPDLSEGLPLPLGRLSKLKNQKVKPHIGKMSRKPQKKPKFKEDLEEDFSFGKIPDKKRSRSPKKHPKRKKKFDTRVEKKQDLFKAGASLESDQSDSEEEKIQKKDKKNFKSSIEDILKKEVHEKNKKSSSSSNDSKGEKKKRVTFGFREQEKREKSPEKKAPQSSNKKRRSILKDRGMSQDSASIQQIYLDNTPPKGMSLKLSDSKSKSNSKSNSGPKDGSEGATSESSATSIKRLLRYRRLHSYYPFIADTVKEDSLYDLTGITLNVFFMLRLMVLSLVLVVFQTGPLIQILMLNFVNLSYLLWIFRAMIKDKVVESTCDILHKSVLEVAIQVFLTVCIFFWKDKDRDFLSTTSSIILQMICIFAICVSLIYELMMVIYNSYKSIKSNWKKRRAMKDAMGMALEEYKAFGNTNKASIWGINERGVKRMRMGRR